jgi:hypothetical protein
MAVAAGPPRDREQAVLMGADERLEGPVEVLGEAGDEACVRVGGGEFDHHIRFNTLGRRKVAPRGGARRCAGRRKAPRRRVRPGPENFEAACLSGMGIPPDGGGPLRTGMDSSNRAAPADDLPADQVSTEDVMSASTGTIQRPSARDRSSAQKFLAAVALLAVIATRGAL